MKVLIIGTFHHKNKEGLKLMLSYLNFEYKWGNYNDIPNYDLIFMPDNPIDTSKFPLKKFIFGNHFSVFPTNKILDIKNIYKNSIYIQPSEWASQVWRDMKAETFIPIKTLPFAVNTDKFKPNNIRAANKVFIYFKARKQQELNILTSFLNTKNIQYEIFDYRKKYDEKDYIRCLQESKYGIWLGRHESQGFGLQEALSMNVPLLVWDVKSMNQEEGYNYPEIFGTVIPYFDERCGEYFYDTNEFESKYNEFISKLNTYKPREYVLENLSVEKCAEMFMKLL
tara:strand:+ start:441 stop:1286 length:846 start_codon:yes stop_codon:yes gene_type:complete